MRALGIVLGAAAAGLALPAGASAATLTLDRACYVSGQAGTVRLAGFAPNAAITVASPALGSTTVTTNDAGAAAVPITPPSGEELTSPGSRQLTVTATEADTPSVVARATARYAPLAFRTAGGTTSATAKRAWSFSGWSRGKPIYAHFRFKGRTRGTYRFGTATGVCGELRRRAPAIVSKNRVTPGTWSIYVDQRKAFSARTRPQLKDTTPVFTSARPRGAAPGAVGLVTVAPGQLPRFV